MKNAQALKATSEHFLRILEWTFKIGYRFFCDNENYYRIHYQLLGFGDKKRFAYLLIALMFNNVHNLSCGKTW
jgi:hypothetical protein